MMNKLLLIDGTALVFRGFYGIRNPMINSQGLPTNAIYGFFSMTFKCLLRYKPTHFAICFDRSEPTRRHTEYKEYKANRSKAPDDLYTQLVIIKQILENTNFNLLEKPGHEADDIIATLQQVHSPNIPTQIYSADFDLLQLVDNNTTVITPSSKEEKILDLKASIDKYQIQPTQIPDFKGLSGDSSDNLPGVKGIGPKTAVKLIQDYKTLEGIYENIDKHPAKIQEKLKKDKEIAFLCKNLATLDKNVPVDTSLERLKIQNISLADLTEEFQKIEFRKLLQKLRILHTEFNIPLQKIDPSQTSLF